MKLVEIAKKAVEILKESGEEGVFNLEMTEQLGIPRRRVYDVIAILNAAGMLKAKRQKQGTRVYWRGSDTLAEQKIEKLIEMNNELKKENRELQMGLATLNEELKNVTTVVPDNIVTSVVERSKIKASTVRVVAQEPGTIRRTYTDGTGVVIETTAQSISVEPVIKKISGPWKKHLVFTNLKSRE